MKLQLQKTRSDLALKPFNTTSAEIVSKLRAGQVIEVELSEKKRSLSKNALSHVWYSQLDKAAFQDHSAGYARLYCKLHFGIAIMMEDEDFRARYEKLIKSRFSYEEKIEIMDWLPVTSLMTNDQMGRYLNTIQRKFAESGNVLSTPKDSDYEKWCQ